MSKEVLFGAESRNKILVGVQKITKAVGSTMGANGKCVLIGDSVYHDGWMVQLPTKVTKDGFTVAKHFQLQDAAENRGAMMIVEAATKTVEMVGDGTTCTCVLAEYLISNGMKLIDGGANSQQLKRGMDSALEYIVSELKIMSIPVKGDINRVRQIATVSSNNDTIIGNLIADAFSKIGDDGVIDIQASQGVETEIKISEGFKFERGWVSPLFVNNKAKESCEFENPLIVLYEKKIIHHTQIKKAVELAMQAGRPLLIICEDTDEEGLAFLAMNTIQGRIKVCVVKSPEFGDIRREYMEDIATVTGGTYISDSKGVGISEVGMQHLGEAKRVIITKNETVIVGGKKDRSAFDEFVADLKMNLVQAKTEGDKSTIEKRIARLTGGIAVIHVGAATETELNEKMDRVDDAVRATKAAISEGFVAGGGVAFLRIPLPIVKDDSLLKGYNLVFDSLEIPMKQICTNAGVDAEDILNKVKSESGDVGYNALTGVIENMVTAGIIDSTKALRCALTNAVSVAGMVLTSECSIITIN